MLCNVFHFSIEIVGLWPHIVSWFTFQSLSCVSSAASDSTFLNDTNLTLEARCVE